MKTVVLNTRALGVQLLFLLAAVSVCYADLSPDTRFEHFRHGLSSQTINDIARDSLGFIWIATPNAVNRFDGVHFTHFRFSDRSESLLNDRTETLFT
ncbi:two-component regulator propeller domain-containing protein, partial [Balneolaceae bacterium ANBcel3]|nr:two-component regulator propeller domain-containing protein [Balneolaceae bacterium ANBcel3]